MIVAAQRAASGGSGAGPGAKLPDPVPDRLPFARAASVIAVILLAGALFGYDQGVISGALLGIQKTFAVGAVALEIVTSWVTLGAMFGSLAGGYVADHFGRKRALFAAAALFIIGAHDRGAFAERSGAGVRPAGGRLRRGRRRGRGPALCGGARSGRAARAIRLGLSARNHGRHLCRLSRRPGAGRRRGLARHAWRLRGRRRSARARRPDRSRVAPLAGQDRPSRRRPQQPCRSRRRDRRRRAARGDQGVAAARA